MVPGLLLISQTFVGCQADWVIVLLTLSLASNGASTITNLSNAQDLAPNFAGSLYGIANCIGSTTGFISPMVVGYLTADHVCIHFAKSSNSKQIYFFDFRMVWQNGTPSST